MPEAGIQVVLKKNGDVVLTDDGTKTVIATYDAKTKAVEFESKEYHAKYYNQTMTAVGTTDKGLSVSENKIRSITIKGEAKADLSKAPKRPKLGVLGDSAEDVVQWYLTYNLPEAITRYGLYLDDRGQPIRKKCRRMFESIVDNRDLTDRDLTPVKDSASSEVKAPVIRSGDVQVFDNAYVAKRATALTFTPSEVIGGFQPDDDYEPAHAGEEEND